MHGRPAMRYLARSMAAILVPSLLAQQELPERTFRATVNVVVAPVTVMTRTGRYVSGLEAKDFRLYDNGKLQDIRLDVTYNPVSIVVAIQRNADVEALLPKIRQIGPMIEALLVGERGEAALVAFDHQFKLLQDFTNDGQKFKAALEQLRPGSSTSALIDCVFYCIRLLRRRPPDHRKVLILISETRDKGSEGRMREALMEAEFNNVIIYTINMNRLVTSLTKKAPPPPPSPFPAASRPLPGPAAQTPTNVDQLRGVQSADFVPIIKEIFTQVKSIFIPNPAEVFTRYTGGREFSFSSLKDLEQALTELGEELHSQYILSYTPNNLEEGGYHSIRVEVNRPNLIVRTRPGYWMAAKFPQAGN